MAEATAPLLLGPLVELLLRLCAEGMLMQAWTLLPLPPGPPGVRSALGHGLSLRLLLTDV